MKRVAAVMVVYNPDLELLKRNLQAIAGQVERVYIIDNTPEGDLSEWEGLPADCVYAPLRRNTGIATAQNEGIHRAISDGAEYLYFLDQDSISPQGIISGLISLKESLEKKGVKTGAVGALPYNRESDVAYIPTTPSAAGIDGITEVTELISSGSLIPVSVLKEVGGMMDELFIDGVDHEWCWRATYQGGYRFFVSNNLRLSHQLGRGDRKLLWLTVAMPSPVRTYYLYRNIFILCCKSYVPFSYKVKNAAKLAAKIFYYPLFISPRRKYADNIFRGIRDGFKSLRRK